MRLPKRSDVNARASQLGFTIMETLIGLAILSIVSTSIYFAYSNVLDIVQSAQYNSVALDTIESEVESVRNMRYEDVGVAGGVPQGLLAQEKIVSVGTTDLVLHTYVRNIDDPFDGTLGGTPGDTAPADYKLVEFQVTCDTCPRHDLISMSTYVAPKNLESTSRRGNLFIRVFDAAGIAVSGATVHITNTLASPDIDLTDITNTDGMLQLVDTATGSAAYRIEVSKSGYSSDRTYAPGSPANPVKPDATVANQQLTIASFAIDRVSSLTIRARDQFCAPTAGFDALVTGAKNIGTSPDTPKYSVAHATDANGLATLGSLEWDTYSLVPTDTTFDIAGAHASLSFAIDPNTQHTLTWMTHAKSSNALLVSVVDASGQPLNDALVHVTGTGYDESRTTGHWTLTQTEWPAGSYDSASAFIETSSGGVLTLKESNGSYASASEEWLISNTFDIGTSSMDFDTLNWSPTTQPQPAGGNSLRMQLAANNDNTTWTWVGPDGTGTSYFTTSGDAIPAALNGNRYVRYRALLKTDDESVTPSLEDISINYTSGCVMSGQAYVNGLALETYNVTITRSGYQPVTLSVPIGSAWERIIVSLTP